MRIFKYIPYCQDIFKKGRNANYINELKKALKEEFKEFKKTNKKQLQGIIPYLRVSKDYHQDKLEDTLTGIDDLIKVLSLFSTDENIVIAEYIDGEDNAFKALINSIKKARKSIRTTRFSPNAVVDRQKEFFQTIKEVMDSKKEVKSFSRIIAVNHEKKYEEIDKLILNNLGHNFTIYLSRNAYNFEIVIIDEEIVFIHFKESDAKNAKQEQEAEIISATLKFKSCRVADEFIKIFDSMKADNIIRVVHCAKLNRKTYNKEMNVIKRIFNKELNQKVMS
ncbi:MAG: hypothetical protein LBC85_09955 [Fibromonadaceae bacterium]|nr:hypothetical protein [Fibromonadaceae bacterium]